MTMRCTACGFQQDYKTKFVPAKLLTINKRQSAHLRVYVCPKCGTMRTDPALLRAALEIK
jgi:predicted RNA-binding Zn-ribbon protein involved in translation (DUF1610 family)